MLSFGQDSNQYFLSRVVAISTFWNYQAETRENIGDLVGVVWIETNVLLQTKTFYGTHGLLK